MDELWTMYFDTRTRLSMLGSQIAPHQWVLSEVGLSTFVWLLVIEPWWARAGFFLLAAAHSAWLLLHARAGVELYTQTLRLVRQLEDHLQVDTPMRLPAMEYRHRPVQWLLVGVGAMNVVMAVKAVL